MAKRSTGDQPQSHGKAEQSQAHAHGKADQAKDDSQYQTFEQVHAHVEQADLEQFKATDKATATANICGIWGIAKPVVAFLGGFPLLPAKWRSVVQQLSTTIDLLCAAPPVNQPALE